MFQTYYLQVKYFFMITSYLVNYLNEFSYQIQTL